MEKENYSDLIELVNQKKELLKEYIEISLKKNLREKEIRDFLSFNLINDNGEIEKKIIFSGDKTEYIKIFWSILRGKKKYGANTIEMLLTNDVLKYTAEHLLNFYRQNKEIIISIIEELKKGNFVNIIRNSINNKKLSEDNTYVKSLYEVFEISKQESDSLAMTKVIKLLEAAFSSEITKNYVYEVLKDTEIANELRWELRKYLYTALGITVGASFILPFIPILIAGAIFGVAAFKNKIINLIATGVANKITDNIRITSQAIFNAINFQEILSNEILNSIDSEKTISKKETSKKEKETEIKNEKESMDLTSEVQTKVKNIFAYLKVLAAMMWSDGKLMPEEIEFWKKVTSLDLGLSRVQIKELEDWFKEGPNLTIIGAEIRDKNERLFVTRQAMLMSMIDGEVAPKEIELIQYLVEQFELSDKEINTIENEAKELLSYT